MAASKNHLPQTLLKELFDYSPGTGDLTWKVPYGKSKIGDKVGFRVPSPKFGRGGPSALYVYYGGREYTVHVLIWIWMTGEPPKAEIDHENRDNNDNRWLNLREATRAQNQTNTNLYRNNKCGRRGVHRFKGRFRAVISIDGRNRHLGYYDSEDAAAEAWRAAADKHNRGDFAVSP